MRYAITIFNFGVAIALESLGLRLLRCLVGTTLGLICVATHAQALWGDTRLGMSPQEVKAVVQNLGVPKKPSRLRNGAEELLRSADVEIASEIFWARFYFKSEKLNQVFLSLVKRPPYGEASRIFDNLVEILRVKYGPEMGRKDDGSGILSQRRMNWIAGDTDVTLYLVSVREKDAILNIIYRGRIAEAAN